MLRRPRSPRHDAVLRRNRIAILLDAGLTVSEISDRIGVGRSTVYRAIERFRELLSERGIDVMSPIRRTG